MNCQNKTNGAEGVCLRNGVSNVPSSSIPRLMSFADLKRDLQVGRTMTLVEAPFLPNHKFLNLKRNIIQKQTNGIYLDSGAKSTDKPSQKGSFLELRNAKLTEYDGHEIRIYRPGHRPLSDEEQKVWNNRPSNRSENEEIVVQDVLSDGSRSYWMDKEHLKKNNMEYLMESGHSKRFDYNTNTIIDDQIKGDLELKYILEN